MRHKCSELINDAARVNGKLGPGRTLSPSELNDAFRMLVRILDAWNIESLMCFATRRNTYPLIPNKTPITIGPGGDWDVLHPIRVDNLGLILTGTSPQVETPLTLMDDEEWAAESIKGLTGGQPSKCWFSATWPLAELYFWPVPTDGNSIALYSEEEIGLPETPDDYLDLPPGYELAIVDQLAVSTCIFFDVPLTDYLLMAARDSKSKVKSANHSVPVMRVDDAITCASPGPAYSRFYTGD